MWIMVYTFNNKVSVVGDTETVCFGSALERKTTKK